MIGKSSQKLLKSRYQSFQALQNFERCLHLVSKIQFCFTIKTEVFVIPWPCTDRNLNVELFITLLVHITSIQIQSNQKKMLQSVILSSMEQQSFKNISFVKVLRYFTEKQYRFNIQHKKLNMNDTHKLPNNFQFRILGDQKILTKLQKWMLKEMLNYRSCGELCYVQQIT